VKKVFGIIIAVAAVIVLVGALGWKIHQKITTSQEAGGGPSGGTRGRTGAVIAVDVAPVRVETIRDIGVFSGSLKASSEFLVAPKVAGRLERLLVNVGDPVERGQLIAELEDEEYSQQREQARADLRVAEASLEEITSNLVAAQREFERVRDLREKNIATEQNLDTVQAIHRALEAKYKVAQAQIAEKQAAVKAAEARLAYTRIHAEWEGGGDQRVVGERFRDEGAMLAANAPIVSILDIDKVTAVIYVTERDYSRIRIGQEATLLTDAWPGETFTATVIRIAPLLKETSREALVEMETADSGQRLRPGMFVRARIEFSRHDEATVIPLGALTRRADAEGVFLVDPKAGTARFVPVRLGIAEENRVEVVEPPLSGLVVTLGHHLLEDGAGVLLPESYQAAPAEAKP
jgi:RND family efflux transporter MFP subunit